MAGATRSSNRKQPVRSVPSSRTPTASSSATVADEHINAVTGTHEHVSKQERSYSHSDMSRLSQEFESMATNNRRSSSSASVGEANALGEHMKEAIAVINKLEGLGLQRLKIPLPKCAVLGEQSTGKSSVIEAISGIKTPRATDTCTRCPLFIHMEPSADPHANWNAHVSIRRLYHYDGVPRTKFPGWIANPNPQDEDFDSTNSPMELEHMIKRAQTAALSPLSNVAEFRGQGPFLRDPDSFHQCPFSPNIVCIHVSKPDLPSLSFYDLPGIINQSETEADRYLVKFVKDLVMDYVEDPESLILVTCPLDTDIANSSAAGMARELKTTGRCVGVLTKPDRLPPGTREDRLRAVFDGQLFSLDHGYFVVKNPGQDDIARGLTHSDARVQEEHFFNQNEPWSTSLQSYHTRFGTRNLQTYLSVKLTSQIVRMLPEIRKQVEARLKNIDAELQQLPEPPTFSATRTVSDILQAFAEHVRKEMEADWPHRAWHNQWDLLHRTFFEDIVSMKPTMSLTPGKLDHGIFAAGTTPGRSVDDSIIIDSEDEGSLMTDGLITPKKRKVEEPSTPMRMPTSPGRTPAPSRSNTAKPAKSSVGRFFHLHQKFRLDDVATHLRVSSKSRIPDQLDPKVVEKLMMETIQEWHQPLQRFFNDLEQHLNATLKSIFYEHFGKWQGSALCREAWKIVENLLACNFGEQRDAMAKECLEDERDGPHVFNEGVFIQEFNKTREYYRQHRSSVRLEIYRQESIVVTGRALTRQEEERVMKDEKKRALIYNEPYEKEVVIIARITSYYMIAARRFYESITMRITSKFFKRLRTTLRDDLDKGLGIHDDVNGPQNAMQLLAEPSHRLQHRRELNDMKRALNEGLVYLDDLDAKYGDKLSSQPAGPADGMPACSFSGPSFGPPSTPLTDDMVDIARGGMVRR